LQADYKFGSFAKTWKFLNSIVIPAHTLKHHPTITTTYNKVKIELTTHDQGNKITSLDFKLAELINQTY
ncbi:pterin-4-alpha-carbinolamine dehydratase, partial [Suhomyces tanzawaensis NRRL Y-17324]